MYPAASGQSDTHQHTRLLGGVFLLSVLIILLMQYSGLFREQQKAVVNAVQEEFLRQETDVSAMLLNRKFFLELVSSIENRQLASNEAINTLKNLSSKPYSIALYKEDSLIYWNKPGLVIEPDYLSQTEFPVFASDHVEDYVLKRYQIYSEEETYQAFSKIPVLGASFKEKNIIVTALSEESRQSKSVIFTQEGTPVCELQFQEEMLTLIQQVILFASYLAAFLSLILLIGRALEMQERIPRHWWFVVLAVIVVGLRLGILFLPYHDLFNRISIATPIFGLAGLQYGLADLFLDSMLTCGLVLYWLKHAPRSSGMEAPDNLWIRSGMIVSQYLFMVLATGIFAWVPKYVISTSSLNIDLENIAFFNATNFLLFGSVGILGFALFLLCWKLIRDSSVVEQNLYRRIGGLLLASAISVPVLKLLHLSVPFFGFYLAVFIFLILLDFYIESRSRSVIWVISWVVLISGFSAVLLFKYHLDRDAAQRLQLAHSIASTLDESTAIDEQVLSWLPQMPAQYNLGIFRRGQLVYSYNASYPLQIRHGDISPTGGTENAKPAVQSEVISGALSASRGNFTVIIGKRAENLMSVVSLFSYLFTIFSILLFLIALLNSLADFLPEHMKLSLSPKPSLSNRIQLSIVFLIILSFIIIGFVTVFYLRNSSDDRDKRLFEDRLRTIAGALHQAIPENEKDLKTIIPRIAGIAYTYNRQAKLFDPDGNLLMASRVEQRSHPRTAVKMSYLSKLALDYSSRNFVIEEPGDPYPAQPTGYLALRNGDQPMGYVAIPLNPRNANRDDVSARFLATLLNAYVFLFLIAVALAIAVANSITRPLSELADKLKQFNIGKKNETLRWNSDDEIGVLINDYNAMINKLDESTQILARTERDLAWREMAKQVAHEIKNPLTPMKLSIQYLQNSLKADSDLLREKAERVSHTLLEQIESLSTIASEFSNFATMPLGENEKIVLNDVVASVHDLFRKRDDMDISLYVPIQDITVFADRNQLIRVLNNILKNAIQAIPDDKRGAVEISLTKEDDHAIIEVKDNGVGIPEHMQDKVFTPNFTTKSSGTGLGLAISANIVEAFNGKIYFKSHEGGGTSFYIEIPLMRTEGGQQAQERVVL